jgi:Flp pilus assembly protein TadG
MVLALAGFPYDAMSRGDRLTVHSQGPRGDRWQMTRARRSQNARRGAAIVELALLLPLFLILIAGMWEVARLAEVQQVLTNAAREGGRQASTGQLTNSQIQQVVLTYLQNALNDSDATGNTGRQRSQNAVITVKNMTSNDSSGSPPRTDATGATQFDQFQITVTVPFKDVRWVSLALVTNASTLVTGQTNWYSLKDKLYPAPPFPPLQ